MVLRKQALMVQEITWISEGDTEKLLPWQAPCAWDLDLLAMLGRFGHTSYRPLQMEVCNAVLEGNDIIVQMPTGAVSAMV